MLVGKMGAEDIPTACRYKQSVLLHTMPFKNALQYLVVPKHARTIRPAHRAHAMLNRQFQIAYFPSARYAQFAHGSSPV